MEEEFGAFEQVQIPHSNNPIGIVQSCGILVVRRDSELVELSRCQLAYDMSSATDLWRPVDIRYGPPSRPPIIRKRAHQLDSLPLCIVTAHC